MGIRRAIELYCSTAPPIAERDRCHCQACGWHGGVAELHALKSIVDWVGWQDSAHVVILPEGECPTCGSPAYNALAERRLAAALAAIGPQEEPL
jgi:hypothetical protein